MDVRIVDAAVAVLAPSGGTWGFHLERSCTPLIFHGYAKASTDVPIFAQLELFYCLTRVYFASCRIGH